MSKYEPTVIDHRRALVDRRVVAYRELVKVAKRRSKGKYT
jgi:hypothetical protein